MAGKSIATAYVQVRPSMDGVAGKVRSAFTGAGRSAGGLLGNGLTSALKGTLVASGIGKVISDSIGAGADLQQSLGGVETLFKDNAQTVIQNAQNAYKTAGMSANAYMENVTSFSASLLQGLSGDTVAAAGIADMALQDMSDNANKFGTDMNSITNTYQGFAKQNYTMLDNLKLGYGGTKTEMQRLLADAHKLTGVKYDISNLADVYSAIHVIQNELGVTGTTADEASKTISGSAAAMKAAFTNVLSYLALGMDVEPALNALAETTVTFAKNLIPAVWNVVSAAPGALVTFLKASIPDDLGEVASEGVARFSSFLKNGLPLLFADGGSMAVELANGILNGIPGFVDISGDLMSEFLDSLLSALPQLAASGFSLIGELAAGAISNGPAVLSAVAGMLATAIGVILSHAPQLLGSGISLIGELAAGAISAIPTVVAMIPQMYNSIVSNFTALDWPQIGVDLMRGIANGMIAGASAIIQAAQDAVRKAIKAAQDEGEIKSPSRKAKREIGRHIPAGIALGIEEDSYLVDNAIRRVVGNVGNSVNSNLRLNIAATPSGVAHNSVPANITIHVHAAPGQSAEEIAGIVMDRIAALTNRREAVFA